MMATDFRVIVNAGTKRAETFEKVFGRREVCVQSPIPVWANLPGFDEPRLVYLLDLKELTSEEMTRLVNHVAARFELPVDEVVALLAEHGMPILANECSVAIENPQRWLD